MPAASPTLVPARASLALGRNARVVLALLFAVVWFCNLDYRRLVHPDEGRYAEIPREMVATGDWLTPRLNGIKYFEKPALQYWLTAATYEVFGVRHWTARLWPALYGFLGIVVVGYAGAKLGGPPDARGPRGEDRRGDALAGWYSAAALGGTAWYILNAHILTLDTGLAFWMSAAFCAFVIAQREGAGALERRRFMLATWAALAFAVLSKGLVALVIPGASLVLYSLLQRDFAIWRRLHSVAGTLVFLALAAPWFVAVSRANPEFFEFFFVHEHFTRFLTTEHHRSGGWWYFIPILAVGILPWLPVLVARAVPAWRTPSPGGALHWQRFALVWSAFVFVFFSASGSKLPSYILPMFAPLALVIGAELETLPEATLARLAWPLVAGAVVFALVALFAYAPLAGRFASERQPLAPLLAYGPWIKAAAIVFAAGGGTALHALLRRRRTLAVGLLACSTLLGCQLILTGHDELAESRSTAPILSRIVARDGPFPSDAPFYTVKTYDQTLPYYLRRTVIQVEHPDEMAMGLESEPDKAVPTLEAWKSRWSADARAYALMAPEEYEALAGQGVPMRVLDRDARRVIVSRR